MLNTLEQLMLFSKGTYDWNIFYSFGLKAGGDKHNRPSFETDTTKKSDRNEPEKYTYLVGIKYLLLCVLSIHLFLNASINFLLLNDRIGVRLADATAAKGLNSFFCDAATRNDSAAAF